MSIVTRFTLENATVEMQDSTFTYGDVLASFGGLRLGEEITDLTIIANLVESRGERDEAGFFEVDVEINLLGKTALVNEFELAVLVNYEGKDYAFALDFIEDEE